MSDCRSAQRRPAMLERKLQPSAGNEDNNARRARFQIHCTLRERAAKSDESFCVSFSFASYRGCDLLRFESRSACEVCASFTAQTRLSTSNLLMKANCDKHSKALSDRSAKLSYAIKHCESASKRQAPRRQ